MFTGLVTHIARVKAVSMGGSGEMRLTLENPFDRSDRVVSGESIAINGCCLTVLPDTNDYHESLEFFVSPETIGRTALNGIKAGGSVNLERSLKVGGRLGGHQVSGHIDAVGHVRRISSEGDTSLLEFLYPERFARLLVEKGSVAVSGVSLTVISLCDGIDDSGRRRFGVMVIPHTREHSTLGALSVGDVVNLEFDLAAKYALRSGALDGALDSGLDSDSKKDKVVRPQTQTLVN